jgi:hypothetical protein
VKSIQFYDLQFRHRIDLREYLKKYYSLDFVNQKGGYVCTTDPHLSIHIDGKYENTWVQSNAASNAKSRHGSLLKYGNIINWESIKNDCPIVQAIEIVSKNKSSLSDYKTTHYKKLESLFSKVATRFRYARLPEVAGYLESRGLNYTAYAQEFNIGSPKSYDSLVNALVTSNTTAHEIKDLLSDLFIIRNPRTYQYLPFTTSVTVPVHDKSGDFVGFHGRRVSPGKDKRYYNTGFLRDRAMEVLYGEDKRGIREAIKQKKQLILTKGIFDFFACYQNAYRQVLATLNNGISVQQFDKVVNYPATEIVVGFTAPKEREVILGLMHKSLNQVDLALIDDTRDIDDSVNSGTSLSDIISGALKNMQASEEGVIAAALKKRKLGMETLTEHGQTFLILETDLQTLVKTSKKSPRKMKDFLVAEGAKARTAANGLNFIRFPKTFITEVILDGFGAELRTLLHLLIKTKGGQRPINYTQSTLCADLDVKQQSLNDHLKKLKVAGYLLEKKEIRIEQLKTNRKRTVVFYYYPSTIKF